MNKNKIVEKLEHDLSHFLIEETAKKNSSLRGSPEMYKYKGLNISADPDSKANEKTISVRIGVLEAEFKISNFEKNSGALSPEDERLIRIWMGQSDVSTQIRNIFRKTVERKEIAIIPFDLENFYQKG